MHRCTPHCQTPGALLASPVHGEETRVGFHPNKCKYIVESNTYIIQFLLTDVNRAELRRLVNTMQLELHKCHYFTIRLVK